VSIAGVALPNGRLVWVQTDVPLQPLDRVAVRLPEEIEGTVLVAPDQMVRLPVAAAGTIIRLFPEPLPEPDCSTLPGADLPPLGTVLTVAEGSGRVTALDPVQRTISITPDHGGEAIKVIW